MTLEDAIQSLISAGFKAEITGTEPKIIIGGKKVENWNGMNIYNNQNFAIKQTSGEWLAIISVPNSAGLVQTEKTLDEIIAFILNFKE